MVPHKLKIDKLSVTVPVTDDALRKHIKTSIWDMVKGVGPPDFLWGQGGGYRSGVRIRLPKEAGFPSGTYFHLKADPGSGTKSYVRFEWNPSMVGKKGLDFLDHGDLSQAFPGWREQMYDVGRVTRVDIARDIHGLHIDDIIVWAKHVRAFGLYTGADGRTETIYLGRQKKNQLTVYDQRANTKKQNHGKTDMEKVSVPRAARTRIEARRKDLGMAMHRLTELPNPFAKVVVFHPDPKTFKNAALTYPMFRNACQVRGYKHALAMLPDGMREAYEAKLMASQAEWWQPEPMWEKWPSVLKSAALVP